MDKLAEKDYQLALLNQKKTEHYTIALTNQLIEKETQKQSDHALFLVEKEKIDKLVQKILDENKAQLLERFEKRQETQEYIRKFLVERGVYQVEEEERQRIEAGNIENYVREQDERVQAELLKKKTEKAAQGDIYKLVISIRFITYLKRLQEICKKKKERDLNWRISALNYWKLKTRKRHVNA